MMENLTLVIMLPFQKISSRTRKTLGENKIAFFKDAIDIMLEGHYTLF